MEISEPTAVDGTCKRTQMHARLWRSALFLVGSFVGAVVGIALLAVLAHPAGASALPDLPSLPTVQTVAGSVPLADVEGSTASLVPAEATATSNISSLTSETVRQIPLSAVPTVARAVVTGAGALALPSAEAVLATATTGPGTTPTSGGSGSVADAVGGSPRAAARDRSGMVPATSGPTIADPLPAPIVPSPALPAPSPSPSSPLAMRDVSSDSSLVQGIGPVGLLPLSSLVLAALAVAGVLMAREKKVPLLLDSRCSPPG